jgi:hypothetical protein
MENEIEILRIIESLEQNLQFIKNQILTGHLEQKINIRFFVEEIGVANVLIDEGLEKEALKEEKDIY